MEKRILKKKKKETKFFQELIKGDFPERNDLKSSGSKKSRKKVMSSTKIKTYPDEVIEFQGWKKFYKHLGKRDLSPLQKNNIYQAGLKLLSTATPDEQDDVAMLRRKSMNQNSFPSQDIFPM